MRAILACESAVQLYRARTSKAPLKRTRADIDESFTPSLKPHEADWLSSARGVRTPVHSSVFSDSCRRNSTLLNCTVLPARFPRDELIHLGKELYAASPELAMAQLAGRILSSGLLGIRAERFSESERRLLGIVALAYLGSELASDFAHDENSRLGITECARRLDIAKLARLLDEIGQFNGSSLLKEALNYMLPAAKSPAELQLALFASLPKKLGGRGLPLPILNESHTVNYQRGADHRMPDLLFKDSSFVLEYNGGYHEGERANADDDRRNELTDLGFTVLTVNKERLHNAAALDEVFDTVERIAGSTGRKPSDYLTRRALMRSALFELGGTRCLEATGDLFSESLRPPTLLSWRL